LVYSHSPIGNSQAIILPVALFIGATVEQIESIVASNIKKYRERLGITQEILAERCGLTPQFIAAIEVGIKTPSLESLDRIIPALQIRPYQMFLTDSAEDVPMFSVDDFSEHVISLIRETTSTYHNKKS
jgi:transcriptional regulator with XRE-family HTH domain